MKQKHFLRFLGNAMITSKTQLKIHCVQYLNLNQFIFELKCMILNCVNSWWDPFKPYLFTPSQHKDISQQKKGLRFGQFGPQDKKPGLETMPEGTEREAGQKLAYYYLKKVYLKKVDRPWEVVKVEVAYRNWSLPRERCPKGCFYLEWKYKLSSVNVALWCRWCSMLACCSFAKQPFFSSPSYILRLQLT